MKPVSIRIKDGLLLAGQAWMTEDVTERIEGWLKKEASQPGDGLLIAPCSSIHTFGMRISIDAVFMDEGLRVTRVIRELRPNRLAWGSWRNLLLAWNSQVLELPSGAAQALKVGQVLELEPRKGEVQI